MPWDDSSSLSSHQGLQHRRDLWGRGADLAGAFEMVADLFVSWPVGSVPLRAWGLGSCGIWPTGGLVLGRLPPVSPRRPAAGNGRRCEQLPG